MNTTLSIDFFYPFLSYECHGTFLAITASANGTITSIPIMDIALITSTDNFVPVEPHTEGLGGSEYAITFPASNATKGPTTLAGVVVIYVKIRLNLIAQLYSVLLFTVNWMLTLFVMYVAIGLFVKRVRSATSRQRMPIPDQAFAIPISLILTMPGLRDLFVGNPPRGESISCVCIVDLWPSSSSLFD
jgi:hypothetical protein